MADDAVAETDQDIDFYRKLVQKYIKLHIYHAAQFWAEKVVVLTERNPADVYCLAQTMVLLQQYHRAIHLLQSTELHKAYYLCSYVTAHCLFATKGYQKALNLLESIDMDALSQNESNTAEAGMIDNTPKHEILASILLLKGKVLYLMENHAAATRCFIQALTSDVHCFEAYELIVQHNLLNSVEEKEMIQSLPILQQCSRKDAKVLLTLYSNMSKSCSSTPKAESGIDGQKPSDCGAVPTTCNTELSTESEPSTPVTAGPSTSQSEPLTPAVVASTTSRSEPAVATTTKDDKKRSPYSEGKEEPQENATKKVEQPNQEKEPEKLLETTEKKQFDEVTPSREELEDNVFLSKLEESCDLVAAKAQRYYDVYDYTNCMKLTERVLKEDPYHQSCLIVYIACLMELRLHGKLFTLAHNLVDVYRNMPIAWYTVGCYYLLIGNGDSSQKYLKKSILLSKSFGPAWIALGHVYATMKNDHEQAIFTYTSALRYMRGSHLPFMYMAIECSQTDSALADSYFAKARQAKPNDPGLLQEIGVHEFRCGRFKPASRYFKLALKHIQLVEGPVFSAQWAPVLNNLGHTYRKLRKYAKALDYHHRALALTPESPQIYSAIGFVHSLIGNVSEAIEWFHKALSLHRDAFSTTMLDHLLVQYADEGPVFYEHDAPPQPLATIMEESSDTSSTTTNESLDTTGGCSEADYEVRPSTSGIQGTYIGTSQDDSFIEERFGYDSDSLDIVLDTPSPDVWTDNSRPATPSSDGSMGLAPSVATPQLEISTNRSPLEHSRSSAEPRSRSQSSDLGIASSSISTINLNALNVDDPVDDPLDDPTDK